MNKNKIRKVVLTFVKTLQRASQANKIWIQLEQDDRYLGQPEFPSTLRSWRKKKKLKNAYLEVKNHMILTLFPNAWASETWATDGSFASTLTNHSWLSLNSAANQLRPELGD